MSNNYCIFVGSIGLSDVLYLLKYVSSIKVNAYILREHRLFIAYGNELLCFLQSVLSIMVNAKCFLKGLVTEYGKESFYLPLYFFILERYMCRLIEYVIGKLIGQSKVVLHLLKPLFG